MGISSLDIGEQAPEDTTERITQTKAHREQTVTSKMTNPP